MATCVLKWNPEISSFKYSAYLHILAQPYDMTLDWSIHDWDKAGAGDRVFFLRVRSRPQLLASGYLFSDPYRDEDWSGRGREVYYSDLCFDTACHPDYEHVLTADVLEKAIPDFDWRAGHSGVMLDEKQAEQLELLWTEFLCSHQDDFFRETIVDDDEADAYENDGDEPSEAFVGIIGEDGASFDEIYGISARIAEESPLQKIFTRRYGSSCCVCGYSYRQVFGDGCTVSNKYLYVPELKSPAWEKAFLCVCPSCEEILYSDTERFLKALRSRQG